MKGGFLPFLLDTETDEAEDYTIRRQGMQKQLQLEAEIRGKDLAFV